MISIYIAIAGLFVNLVVALIILKIRNELIKTEIALERKIEQGQSEMLEKIRQVELFTRDNFVRQGIFDRMADMMTTQMQAQFEAEQKVIMPEREAVDGAQLSKQHDEAIAAPLQQIPVQFDGKSFHPYEQKKPQEQEGKVINVQFGPPPWNNPAPKSPEGGAA